MSRIPRQILEAEVTWPGENAQRDVLAVLLQADAHMSSGRVTHPMNALRVGTLILAPERRTPALNQILRDTLGAITQDRIRTVILREGKEFEHVLRATHAAAESAAQKLSRDAIHWAQSPLSLSEIPGDRRELFSTHTYCLNTPATRPGAANAAEQLQSANGDSQLVVEILLAAKAVAERDAHVIGNLLAWRIKGMPAVPLTRADGNVISLDAFRPTAGLE